MDYFSKSEDETIKILNTNKEKGLSSNDVQKRIIKYGENKLSKAKKKNFLKKIFDVLKEPMMLILIFSFIIAFGTKLGQFIKTGENDFAECFGILGAILLSVSITLIMEQSSQKAFSALNKIYDNIKVRVIRDGQVIIVNQRYITVGDVIILESGDKIVADGRLISSQNLSIDESSLTGESVPCLKDAKLVLNKNVPLAERKNSVYSGTYVVDGNGLMVVSSVGDNTEIGKIAGALVDKSAQNSPLNEKLSKLGKTISIIGSISAILVFVLSIVRLYLTNGLQFSAVQDLFISCIVLIVAAVPEGLPTIVAISLALNMIKLAKQNALIKKMIATETAGAVSVICSDKTGTLTQNQMTLDYYYTHNKRLKPKEITNEIIIQNFICNSTCDVIKKGEKYENVGNGTECALIKSVEKNLKISYRDYRKSYPILKREPFSSDKKFMISVIKYGNKFRYLIKGAPEKIIDKCSLNRVEKEKLFSQIKAHQNKAERVLCFAHFDAQSLDDKEINYIFDGYATLLDPLREDVLNAVKSCKNAGIKVKILTGDNRETALAIAKKLNLIKDESEIVSGQYIESLSDENLKEKIQNIVVIARSTPLIKLRVVNALKSLNEVVAVTGDGINDAPAIKQADVGIAMGVSGSEIARESADIVLLDDSFATVVRAIKFGRNVYKNLQRFILFQLSVNLSALLFITIVAILGMQSPFNTLQLLWINVIMDGPPALTLGLERASDTILEEKPVKRSDSIVSAKMLLKILFNGVFMACILLIQQLKNVLNVPSTEKRATIFTLFIFFQLFNAFNCRELGASSIFKKFGKNKVMVITFVVVFIVHLFIVSVCYKAFGISRLSFLSWIKCTALAMTIIIVNEAYKFIYRILKKSGKLFSVKIPRLHKKRA